MSENIISQLLSFSITLDIYTDNYSEGKKSDNRFLILDYTSLFTNTGGINPQTLHNVRCYYAGKKVYLAIIIYK